MTVHEPRFNESDTQAAFERKAAKDEQCPGCGVNREDAWLPDIADMESDDPEVKERAMQRYRRVRRRWAVRKRECAACAVTARETQQAKPEAVPILVDRELSD